MPFIHSFIQLHPTYYCYEGTRACATCWKTLCTWMHYAMRDMKDMRQQMSYHSLEWNWPNEAMNLPYLGRY